MKKFLSLLLVCVMVLSLAACTGDQLSGSGTPANSGAPAVSGPSSIAVCIASEPDTIDPALNSAVDGTVTYTYTLKDGVTWSDG